MGIREYFRQRKVERIELTEIEVQWLGIKGKWVADRVQQQAAWELYVELVTRVATQQLGPNQGLLREALTSIYSLFPETRRILKQYGPKVALPMECGALSLAEIALIVLNRHLRPLLAEWHPRLEAHEATRGEKVAPASHERAWPDHQALREEIDRLRNVLSSYAGLLARACGVEPLRT